MATKPKDIDDYLARLRPEQRVALERLRKQIRSAAPKAEECISYQLPAFRQGRLLVAFGGAKQHCSLYPMSARWIEAHADELADFDLSKGTIRFAPEHPLPAALVRELVKARLTENAALGPLKRTTRTTVKPDRGSAELDAFMRALEHPLKSDIERVRDLILAVDPLIQAGVKWNSLSFRTDDWFATLHLRATDQVKVVFHTGAKAKGKKLAPIDDPLGLIESLAPDRCMVSLGAGKVLRTRAGALREIVRAWLART